MGQTGSMSKAHYPGFLVAAVLALGVQVALRTPGPLFLRDLCWTAVGAVHRAFPSSFIQFCVPWAFYLWPAELWEPDEKTTEKQGLSKATRLATCLHSLHLLLHVVHV